MLNVLPTVFLGYKLGPLWITAMLLGVFNPLTIIAVGPYLAKFSEKIESLKWLMGGVLVYTIGMAFVATLNWILVLIGIVIALSVGFTADGYDVLEDLVIVTPLFMIDWDKAYEVMNEPPPEGDIGDTGQ